MVYLMLKADIKWLIKIIWMVEMRIVFLNGYTISPTLNQIHIVPILTAINAACMCISQLYTVPGALPNVNMAPDIDN